MLLVGGARALVLYAAVLPAPQDPPRVEVSTEIVRVDVVVADKRGDPVVGLTVDDFTLEEDGKPVAIVAFEAPRTGGEPRVPEPQARAAPSALPQTGSVPGDAPTLVVYVDTRSLTPGGLRRVLAGLPTLLRDQLARGGVRAVVFLADERGPRALTGITTDPEEVSRALAEAGGRAPQGHQVSSDERTTLDLVKGIVEMAQLQNLPCERVLSEMQQVVRAHAGSRALQTSETLRQLSVVVAALGSVPGNKSLLYLGESLEQRPAIHLYQQLGDICPAALERDFSSLLAPMQERDASPVLQGLAARANAARVTLYPMDGSGLRAFSTIDVSQGDRRYVASTKTDQVREANLRAGPWILADETGGFPVFDANAPAKALVRLEADLRGRYALGFTPTREPDSAPHTLQVRVRRKGVEVRHRKSWLHAARGDEHVRRTLAALLFGYTENTLGVQVEAQWAARESPAAPGPREVVVRIALSPTARAATLGEAARTSRLRVVMAVRRTGPKSSAIETREKIVEAPVSDTPGERTVESTLPEILVRMPPFEGSQEIGVGIESAPGTGVCYLRLQVRP